MKYKILIVFFVVLAGTLMLASCNRSADKTEEAADSPRSSRGGGVPGRGAPDSGSDVYAVNVTPAFQGELVDYLLVNGDVDVASRVSMIADISGDITDIYVKVGQTVRDNQILMKIDPSKPGQSFEPRLVRSNISGTVVGLPVEIGSSVGIGSRVAEVAKTTDLEINLDVVERFVTRIEENQQVIIRFDAFPGESFEGYIAEISPVLDPTSRTLSITVKFSERDPRVKAGMFALTKIVTERKQEVVQIPSSSVLHRFGETLAYVIDGDTAYERKLSIGVEIDGRVEIQSGVEPKDLVVIQGQGLLSDQTKVRVVQNTESLNTPQEL